MLILQYFKHKIATEPNNSTLRYIVKGTENACPNIIYTKVLTIGENLFTIGENKTNVNQLINRQIWYTHNEILHGHRTDEVLKYSYNRYKP